VHEETLSAFVEQRCKRFDDVKPLASPPSAHVERLSVLEETLSAFVEQRCKRFDDVKPLASPPSARAERPSVLEETLSAFVEQRCKRLEDGEPLASPRLIHRPARVTVRTRKTSLVPPRAPGCHVGCALPSPSRGSYAA